MKLTQNTLFKVILHLLFLGLIISLSPLMSQQFRQFRDTGLQLIFGIAYFLLILLLFLSIFIVWTDHYIMYLELFGFFAAILLLNIGISFSLDLISDLSSNFLLNFIVSNFAYYILGISILIIFPLWGYYQFMKKVYTDISRIQFNEKTAHLKDAMIKRNKKQFVTVLGPDYLKTAGELSIYFWIIAAIDYFFKLSPISLVAFVIGILLLIQYRSQNETIGKKSIIKSDSEDSNDNT